MPPGSIDAMAGLHRRRAGAKLHTRLCRGNWHVKNPSMMLFPVVSALWLLACTPTVQVAVPDKPITINLNVKIEHEIRIKVEKELGDLFTKDSKLF